MKIKEQIGKRQFQVRISIVGIICSVLAILLSALAMFKGAEQSMNRLSEQFLQKLVRQVSMNIDDTINRYSSIFISIELDSNFNTVLNAANSGKLSPEISNVNELQQNLFKVQLANKNIKGIYVFDSNGNTYYSSSSPSLIRNYDIRKEEWFDRLKSNKNIIVLGSYVPDRYLMDKTAVISLVQGVEDLSSNTLSGTIVIDIDSMIFDNIVATLEPASDTAILIVDENNNIVYQNYGNNDSNYEQIVKENILNLNSYLTEDEGMISTVINGSLINVNYTSSSVTGWKTLCFANLSEISQLTENIVNKIILVLILAIIFTGFTILFITKQQFKTLYNLKTGMDEVRNGNYDVKVRFDGHDEISTLCDTFNDMVERINYYINTVERLEYEKQAVQLKKVQAELDTLQAQINPHFIYNSLETISMMAEVNDDEDTEKMASSLGKLMRVSIKGPRIITVKDELKYLNYYITIQKTRFGDKFDVDFNVDPEILDFQIPKLILQPLVENCINHGICNGPGKGLVTIRGYHENNTLLLEVEDNGIGIDEEKLAIIQDSLNESKEHQANESIGLKNVNQRIKLYFNDDRYGISISSHKGIGTKIVIKCPTILYGGNLND